MGRQQIQKQYTKIQKIMTVTIQHKKPVLLL